VRRARPDPRYESACVWAGRRVGGRRSAAVRATGRSGVACTSTRRRPHPNDRRGALMRPKEGGLHEGSSLRASPSCRV
jgi:hypothetical protein